MSRYAEYEALSAVGSAYGRWVDANTGLDVAMDAAAAQGAAPPVAADETAAEDLRPSRIISTKRVKIGRRSCGPGLASGWP